MDFKLGDYIERLKDKRIFQIDFYNVRVGKGKQTAVFSAKPVDGKWSSWGGPLGQLSAETARVLTAEELVQLGIGGK